VNACPPITATAAIVPSPAEARMGEMLMSAIKRGALIDRRWWTPWIVGVQGRVTYDGGQLCVDMSPRDGEGLPIGRPRRWFADPLTKLLILQWHQDALACSPGTTPGRCLVAIRGQGAIATEAAMDRLALRASEAWSLRIPGVLHGFASGKTLSFSSPGQTWRRLAFSLPLADALDAHVVRFEKMMTRRERSQKARPSTMIEEMRALRPDRLGRTDPKWKTDVGDEIKRLMGPLRPIKATLRQWLIHSLSAGPGTFSKGYSPATLRGYLPQLDRAFSRWSDSEFMNATPAQIRELFTDYLGARVNPDDDTPIKAMLAFARFRDAEGGGEGLALELDEYWSEKPGAADLVPPNTYARALTALDRSGDDDAALLLILAFRTGARINELRAMRVGDFALSPAGFEMVIEKNRSRLLKTPTSRRIVPLDVLLEPVERARLERHLADRRAAGGEVAEAWMFGEPLSVEPPTEKAVEALLTASLVCAGGSDSITAGHLRHSFASFLLATLMLPRDVEQPGIPEDLTSVISLARLKRVADRLLGAERIGAGAVHAVSQLVGHTGPAMTLRWYCHLLDFVLGLYVSRPSVMRPIEQKWLLGRLGVGADAARKARSRNRADPLRGEPEPEHSRPSPAAMLGATPDVSEGMAHGALLAAAAVKRGRSMQREQWGAAERSALHGADGTDRAWASRSLACPPNRRSLPWPSIMTALTDRQRSAASLVTDEATLRRWRLNAQPTIVAIAKAWCPKRRDLIALVEDRLHIPRSLRRPEREALQTIRNRWLRGARDIRLKKLREARALVELLAKMGFAEGEVLLGVTGLRGAGLSSTHIHDFLAGKGPAMFLAGRGGWRGSLTVRLAPRGHLNSDSATEAARFAVLMMAIDADRP
jgi:integrase